MTNGNTRFLEDPFHSYEHDQDPIMVASRSEKTTIRWRYCTEPVYPPPPHQMTMMMDTPPLNLIALGRTGDGKSSLLNDLLGSRVFEQKISAKSQTKVIQSSKAFWAPLHPYMHKREDYGCCINVVDTPGFGDSQMRDGEFFDTIQQAMLDVSSEQGGIHCVLLVFKITTNLDNVLKSIEAFYNLISPYTKDDEGFWNNVLLVFTHADIVNGSTTRYQKHKVALKTKVHQILKEKYNLKHELPMLWISTQKYTCGFLKGLSECDCEKGNRYHSDCRRRLYEQVRRRRNDPILLCRDSQ